VLDQHRLTGQDLLKLYREPGAGTVVEDLMTRELRTISADASLREAADLMLEQEVHRLVVLDADPAAHTTRNGFD